MNNEQEETQQSTTTTRQTTDADDASTTKNDDDQEHDNHVACSSTGSRKRPRDDNDVKNDDSRGNQKEYQRKRKRILLGITGSVAAVKGPELALKLMELGDVKIVFTQAGYHFWNKAKDYDSVNWNQFQSMLEQKEFDKNGSKSDLAECSNKCNIQLIQAQDEWKEWNIVGDAVMHIDLRNWADLILIAPLSAHTLAKLANGLCDDTLSCIMRAWDFGVSDPKKGNSNLATNDNLNNIRSTAAGAAARTDKPAATVSDPPATRLKPIILAPAMNTHMWNHPLTQSHLESIKNFSFDETQVIVVPPKGSSTLACGEIGAGALAAVDDVVQAVLEQI